MKFKMGDRLDWNVKTMSWYPSAPLEVLSITDKDIHIRGDDGKVISGIESDFKFYEETTLTDKDQAFIRAVNMLPPDALLENQIKLAEWLMK